MEVRVASPCGFCFGVRRALELTEGALSERSDLHMLGNLIHNRSVVEDLAARGLTTVASLDEVEGGAVVIRAHGVPRLVYDEAAARGLDLVDATCPFVTRAQEAAALLAREGYTVVLVGDPDHAEVRGIVSAAGGQALVVDSPDELPPLPPGARVGVLFQTTQQPEQAPLFAAALAPRVRELRQFNTVCRATADRQRAVRALAPEVDVMVVVGDPGSANTGRLTAIARDLNPRTVQVEGADDLDPAFFDGARVVGLTAGASTPDAILEAVRRRIEAL